MDFYNRKQAAAYTEPGTLKTREAGKTVLIYTDADGLAALRNDSVPILEDTVLQHFHVSTFSRKFLVHIP